LDFCLAVAPLDWFPLAEHAASIARWGISCLELTWLGFPFWDEAGCRWMREVLAEAGLTVNSVHLPFGGEVNILSPDPGLRLHSLEAHRSLLRGSVWLGAETVVMHPGREYRSVRPPSEVVGSCIEALRDLTARAADVGLQVALENVLRANALSSHALLREIVEAVGRPELGFCLDTGHANIVDSVEEAMADFAGRIKHVHIHDNHGVADEHLLPSRGTIRWEGFVDRLRATGYAGPLTLECPLPQGMTPGEVLPVLRGVFGEG
jgi:sugar phosphate isomerase/epimerase